MNYGGKLERLKIDKNDLRSISNIFCIDKNWKIYWKIDQYSWPSLSWTPSISNSLYFELNSRPLSVGCNLFFSPYLELSLCRTNSPVPCEFELERVNCICLFFVHDVSPFHDLCDIKKCFPEIVTKGRKDAITLDNLNGFYNFFIGRLSNNLISSSGISSPSASSSSISTHPVTSLMMSASDRTPEIVTFESKSTNLSAVMSTLTLNFSPNFCRSLCRALIELSSTSTTRLWNGSSLSFKALSTYPSEMPDFLKQFSTVWPETTLQALLSIVIAVKIENFINPFPFYNCSRCFWTASSLSFSTLA